MSWIFLFPGDLVLSSPGLFPHLLYGNGLWHANSWGPPCSNMSQYLVVESCGICGSHPNQSWSFPLGQFTGLPDEAADSTILLQSRGQLPFVCMNHGCGHMFDDVWSPNVCFRSHKVQKTNWDIPRPKLTWEQTSRLRQGMTSSQVMLQLLRP